MLLFISIHQHRNESCIRRAVYQTNIIHHRHQSASRFCTNPESIHGCNSIILNQHIQDIIAPKCEQSLYQPRKHPRMQFTDSSSIISQRFHLSQKPSLASLHLIQKPSLLVSALHSWKEVLYIG